MSGNPDPIDRLKEARELLERERWDIPVEIREILWLLVEEIEEMKARW